MVEQLYCLSQISISRSIKKDKKVEALTIVFDTDNEAAFKANRLKSMGVGYVRYHAPLLVATTHFLPFEHALPILQGKEKSPGRLVLWADAEVCISAIRGKLFPISGSNSFGYAVTLASCLSHKEVQLLNSFRVLFKEVNEAIAAELIDSYIFFVFDHKCLNTYVRVKQGRSNFRDALGDYCFSRSKQEPNVNDANIVYRTPQKYFTLEAVNLHSMERYGLQAPLYAELCLTLCEHIHPSRFIIVPSIMHSVNQLSVIGLALIDICNHKRKKYDSYDIGRRQSAKNFSEARRLFVLQLGNLMGSDKWANEIDPRVKLFLLCSAWYQQFIYRRGDVTVTEGECRFLNVLSCLLYNLARMIYTFGALEATWSKKICFKMLLNNIYMRDIFDNIPSFMEEYRVRPFFVFEEVFFPFYNIIAL
ncbi:MAG: hypothetical protein V1693_02110 [Nanoarchaeota archaeon]